MDVPSQCAGACGPCGRLLCSWRSLLLVCRCPFSAAELLPDFWGPGGLHKHKNHDSPAARVQKTSTTAATVSPAEGVCVGVDAGVEALGADWGGGAECSAATCPEEDQKVKTMTEKRLSSFMFVFMCVLGVLTAEVQHSVVRIIWRPTQLT